MNKSGWTNSHCKATMTKALGSEQVWRPGPCQGDKTFPGTTLSDRTTITPRAYRAAKVSDEMKMCIDQRLE